IVIYRVRRKKHSVSTSAIMNIILSGPLANNQISIKTRDKGSEDRIFYQSPNRISWRAELRVSANQYRDMTAETSPHRLPETFDVPPLNDKCIKLSLLDQRLDGRRVTSLERRNIR